MALPTDINPFVQFAGGASGDLGEPIGQSLRFNGLQANVLTRSQVTTNLNGNKNFTFSTWFKLGDIEECCIFGCHHSSQENWLLRHVAGKFDTRHIGNGVIDYDTVAKFRDSNAWYHLFLTMTGGEMRLWVNNQQTSTVIPSTHQTGLDRPFCIGAETETGGTPADMYLAETYFIQQVPSGNGPADDGFIRLNEDGIYVPALPTIADYGDNGFHLTYDSTQANGVGHDSSGKGNHFTVTGFNTTAISGTNLENDIDYLDTPTANYALFNNLWDKTEPTPLFAGGRNIRTANTIVAQCNFRFPVGTTGKYWVEAGTANSAGSLTAPVIALTSRLEEGAKSDTNWRSTDNYSAIAGYQSEYTNFNTTSYATYTDTGPTVAMGIDFDNQQVLMYNGGTLINTDTTVDFTVELALNVQQPTSSYNTYQPFINTGQQTYQQSPPSADYKHLQVNNFPTPTIKNADDHFRIIEAEGTGVTGDSASILSGTWDDQLFTSPTQTSPPVNSNQRLFQSPPGRAFDGDDSSFTETGPTNISGTGCWLVFRPDTPITATTSVVLRLRSISEISVNGGSSVGSQATTSVVDVDISSNLTFPIDISSICLKANSNFDAGLSKITIDGKVLRDTTILHQCQAAFPTALYLIKGNTSSQVWYWIDPMNGTNAAHRTPLPTSKSAYVPYDGQSFAYIWNCPSAFSATGITNGYRNQTAGFSMVQYTGDDTNPRSIPHGLGKKPGWIVLWNPQANDVVTWITGLPGTGTSTENSVLNTNEAAGNAFSAGTLHAPTDNDNFIVGNSAGGSGVTGVNQNAIGYTAFIWAPIAGYSIMGNYTGDGNVSGRFIYCGFKPKFVLIKSQDADPWGVYDTERYETNPVAKILRFEDSGGETDFGGNVDIDIVSNGFKLRGNNGSMNGGSTYQYVAFAESPFGGEDVPPVTAR